MDGYEEERELVEDQGSLPFREDDLGYMLNDPKFCGDETLDDAFMEENRESPEIEANDASNIQAIAAVDDDYYLRPDTSLHYANDLTFGSKAEEKEWLMNKEKEKMCVVVQNRCVKDIRFVMIYELGGEKKIHEGKNNKYIRKTERKYRSHTKKIGCPFKIVFYKPGGRESEDWKISKVVNGCHNDDDPDTLIGHVMVAKLKPKEMETVRSMRIQKVSAILSKIKADDPNNLSSLSTFKSALATIKRTEWDGRTVMQQSEWLDKLHDYTLRREEKDGKVVRIFLAHPGMIQLAQCFHQILLIDVTYKTNKYNMPLLNIACHTSDKNTFTIAWGLMDHENNVSFIWMLATLRSIYNDDDFLRVILTDNDQALMHAIAVVFPEARNLQCTWHIQCNLKFNCHHHFQAKKPRKGSWTYEYRNFKNQVTSIAEGSHGRLNKILLGSQNGVVSIQEAIHEFTNRDLVKIRGCMQFSVHRFPTEHEKERLLLRGVVHKVSRWAINHMMEQLKLYKAYDNENTGCVCKDMIGIGLPCRHKMGRYIEVIDINDIHPFWKKLNFTPSTPVVDGPSWLESELCAQIGERYARTNGAKKQILMYHLEEALHPRLREVGEPIKQKGAGRTSTEVPRTIERKELKEYLCNKRILSRHGRSEAEFEDEPEPKKRGRPRKHQSGPISRQVRPKVSTEPSQVSQAEAVEEIVLVETQTSSVVIDQMSDSQQTQPTEMVTIRTKNGTLRCPRDLHGRPARSTYTIIEEYFKQLPPLIVPFVLSTDEVDGDGNCGFHVATEQMGHFDEAVIQDVTQCQYLRNKMAVQLIKDRDFYMKMMMRGDRHDKEQEFKNLVARVKFRKGLKTIGKKYWMTMHRCGYLLADVLNCVVHFFVPPKYGNYFTFAPTRKVCDESVKDRRIVMAFLNEMHFIGLRVKRDCPLPPLSGWTDYFPTNHCKDWLKQYESNMVDWDRVMNDNYPDGLLELIPSDDDDV